MVLCEYLKNQRKMCKDSIMENKVQMLNLLESQHKFTLQMKHALPSFNIILADVM